MPEEEIHHDILVKKSIELLTLLTFYISIGSSKFNFQCYLIYWKLEWVMNFYVKLVEMDDY